MSNSYIQNYILDLHMENFVIHSYSFNVVLINKLVINPKALKFVSKIDFVIFILITLLYFTLFQIDHIYYIISLAQSTIIFTN